ncbi:endothelin-converting enzyme 1 [Biomphalaria glabrata]|nr:endothelin-converting enzyme 1-like [Biomphalaria glabrata]
MAEAPFGRSESDDDIVEDYDDSVSFKTPCCKGRTPLETLLLILLVLSFSVIIALAVGLTRPQIVPVTQYCQSPACVKAAGSLLSSVDWSVDPCDDFYQFACGHWLKTHPIPRGYRHWDRFQELSDHNLYVLSNLIDSSSQNSSSQSDPSFQKTRQFYQSCMGVRPEKKKEILDQFQALIDDNGGWSYSHNSSLDDWTFMVGLESVHRMGAWPLFKLTVESCLWVNDSVGDQTMIQSCLWVHDSVGDQTMIQSCLWVNDSVVDQAMIQSCLWVNDSVGDQAMIQSCLWVNDSVGDQAMIQSCLWVNDSVGDQAVIHRACG